jgi:hypothetical protein
MQSGNQTLLLREEDLKPQMEQMDTDKTEGPNLNPVTMGAAWCRQPQIRVHLCPSVVLIL